MRKIIFFIIGFAAFIACSNESSKVQVIDNAVSNADTLVYFFENDKNKQELKVVFTSDSTIWYSLGFENFTGTKLLKGEGIDIYYNLDPEIDEVDGEAQPVLEYEATSDDKGLIIRIDMMEKNFAKVMTSPDYQAKEKPFEEVLLKR